MKSYPIEKLYNCIISIECLYNFNSKGKSGIITTSKDLIE